MSVLMSLEVVNKIFNRQQPDELTALKDITIDINPGEVIALTGPSGSGKSTLLSLCGCMARPTSGMITLEDRQISRLPEKFLAKIRRDRFGFIFQQYNLLRDVSVLENVLLPLYPTGMSIKEMRRSADDVLQRFDIQQLAAKKIKFLSGGEQQRVAIARALINQPDIIIADEPTVHLDSHLASELLEIFKSFAREGKTLIIATHDPFVIHSSLVLRQIDLRFGLLEKDILK